MVIDDQSDVIAFLSDPAHYGAGAVERIDTHTASVFLIGDRAYKLKRAVRYDFLDYSTVARRRAACEAEVRLSRRTAPGLYLAASPITRAPTGELAFDGRGAVVDWVVVMKRFPQEQMLDRLAEAGELSLDSVLRLADGVAAFHRRAAVRHDYGGADAIARVIHGNHAALMEATSLDRWRVLHLHWLADEALRNCHSLLEGRRARGMVRQCHGDLHLRNIVLLDGEPTLIDAIEFNDDFAVIDVMYDLAFLLMDLVARELPGHASAAFNRYLLRTGDLEALPALPLFLSCRAAVRAKTSVAAASLESNAARSGDLHARAARYLDLADRLIGVVPPVLVAIGGYSGSGKSTLALRLAPELGLAPGAVVLRTDEIRKQMFAVAAESRLGERAYTAAARQAVYERLFRDARHVLDAGYSVIADAVFSDIDDRQAIETIARGAGVPFHGLWLDADRVVLERRVGGRRGDASDATLPVLRRQLQTPLGALTWHVVDARGTPGDITRAAREIVLRTDQSPSQVHTT